MFALDGPAPVAKLLTQRIRRKRVTLTSSDEKGKTVSPLALTPGTPFMQELHEAMAYYICQRLVGVKWKNLRMELSGSTVQVRRHETIDKVWRELFRVKGSAKSWPVCSSRSIMSCPPIPMP